MRLRVLSGVVVMLALWVAGGVRAQEPPASDGKALVGTWELSNAARDRSCTVALRAVNGGRGAVTWQPQCAELFAFTRQASGWRAGARDAIEFLDASDLLVIDFTEVESGMYEGRRPVEGLLFLQNVTNGAGEERRADQLVGDWNLTRGGSRTLCAMTFLGTPAGVEAFSLRLKPGCDALVTRFGPTTWRFDRGQLLLTSPANENWRFEEGEPMVWRRIPEGRQPLQLVRP